MDLLSIGAFARLAHLSAKALRIYDELGLLPPVRVDPDNGYRWYSPDQLGSARQVALLRRLDMPLARIRKVLDLPGDAAAVELSGYWKEQERSIAAKRELVDFLVNQLNGRKPTMYEVTVREMPERTLLSISDQLTEGQVTEFAGPLFAQFGGPDIPRLEGAAGRPFLRYHGELGAETDGQVEFCCPVSSTDIAKRYPDMRLSVEPGSREAYVQVPKADMYTALGLESLHQWLTEHKEEADWKPRQTFLLNPETADSVDPVYELSVPLR